MIAFVIAIIIHILMLGPIITCDMPKKWALFAISGGIGFITVFALLIIGEAFTGKSDSISKLIGGAQKPQYSDNLFGNMNKVNDLFN